MPLSAAEPQPRPGFRPCPIFPAGVIGSRSSSPWNTRRCSSGGWVYVGHADQLPELGSFIVWRRTGTPILVIRGTDGQIRAFYNTCRHRGAPVVQQEEGKTGRYLSCGYHGWTYDTTGALTAVTDPRDWANLDLSCRSLVSVRCDLLGNWIYVCEDPAAPSLDHFLEPIARYFRHLPLHDLRLVHRRSVEVRGNYKVALENFLEAYHFRLLHRHTTDRIFDNLGTSVHLWEHGHSMMLSPNRRPDWVDPGTIGMPEMSTATIIERGPQSQLPRVSEYDCADRADRHSGRGLLAAGRRPHYPGCHLVCAGLGRRASAIRLWETRIANFDRIVDEDIAFVEPIQESITSPGFRGVPLNYQERRIYHWHAELDLRIGMERVPEHLRVPPVLDDWVERD